MMGVGAGWSLEGDGSRRRKNNRECGRNSARGSFVRELRVFIMYPDDFFSYSSAITFDANNTHNTTTTRGIRLSIKSRSSGFGLLMNPPESVFAFGESSCPYLITHNTHIPVHTQ